MRLRVATFLNAGLLASAIPRLQPDQFDYRWNTGLLGNRHGSGVSLSNNKATHRSVKKAVPVDAVQPASAGAPISAPYTGTVRSYDFTVGRAKLAPDGVEKEMLLVNGQFPGPTITANWGDTIQVTVHNNISGPSEGTAIHYHGFLQSTSQWSDGVPGISECPIAPGQTRVYTFQAQLYGSSWWHSHYSAQYADGAFGPIVINGPSQLGYDSDIGPVMLHDYYYSSYYDLVEDIMGTDLTKVRPSSNNNMINGIGCPPNTTTSQPPVSCKSLQHFKVEKGKKYRMRLINTSAALIQKFSIDDHSLTVIAYDFVPIQPITQQIITLGVAQRADVIFEANGSTDKAYWIRSNASTGACTEPTDETVAWAVLQYQNVGDGLPNTTAHVDTTLPCENDPLEDTTPLYAMTPNTPDITENIEINFLINATGHFLWTMDGVSFRTDYNQPPLLLSRTGNNSYPSDPEWNVHVLNSTGSTRVVLTNKTPTSHPMHLHGHNMYVLAAGTGSWSGTVVNPNNPMRRDVHILPANGYLVLQFDLDNPGVWPLHCHVAWHVSGGLQVTYVERPDDVRNLGIPKQKWGECETWGAYTNNNIVDMIDSGL